jgi:hypothetical protein
LADANVPKPLIDELRGAGLKVETVVEMCLGRRQDENVSQLAKRLKSILLTMDGDIWDERKHPVQSCPGFIFVDVPPDRPKLAVDGLARFYGLFAKFYPLEWWRETKARITEYGLHRFAPDRAGKRRFDEQGSVYPFLPIGQGILASVRPTTVTSPRISSSTIAPRLSRGVW